MRTDPRRNVRAEVRRLRSTAGAARTSAWEIVTGCVGTGKGAPPRPTPSVIRTAVSGATRTTGRRTHPSARCQPISELRKRRAARKGPTRIAASIAQLAASTTKPRPKRRDLCTRSAIANTSTPRPDVAAGALEATSQAPARPATALATSTVLPPSTIAMALIGPTPSSRSRRLVRAGTFTVETASGRGAGSDRIGRNDRTAPEIMTSRKTGASATPIQRCARISKGRTAMNMVGSRWFASLTFGRICRSGLPPRRESVSVYAVCRPLRHLDTNSVRRAATAALWLPPVA